MNKSGLTIIFLLLVVGTSSKVRAQRPAAGQTPGVGVTVDSLHVSNRSADSLWRSDSVRLMNAIAKSLAHDTNLDHVASERMIDLTNDGIPERLRITGKIAKNVDETELNFTIQSGKKLLYRDRWDAKGYFDTIDHLNRATKLQRLARIVTTFFANENYSVLDSEAFMQLIKDGSPADIAIGSPQSKELFSTPRVMYSVYQSRELWYGLVWLPSKRKFVKAWKN